MPALATSRDGALVFTLAGAWLTATALPGVHWHDTGEFAAVSRLLAVSHPPGHPLHAITTHGFMSFLPLGDAAFRANLASAFALALALGFLHSFLRRLAPNAPRWSAIAAALVPAAMPAVWLQGVRVEVYALQIALGAGIGAILGGPLSDARRLALLALVFGLAGANHHLIGAGLLPVAVVAVLVGVRSWRAVIAAVAAGAAGLLTYIYLPIRAHAGGVVGWGAPDNVAALWETISGQAWQKNLAAPIGSLDLGEQVARVSAYFIAQLNPVGAGACLLLAAAGVLPILRRGAGARLAALGLALAAAGVLATRFFYDFDPLNPDIGGYFATALVAAWALVWLAGDALAQSSRAVHFVFPALLLVVVVGGVDPGLRMGSRSAELHARQMLAEVPAGGALVYSDYSSAFLGWASRALEGRRPDVPLVFRGQLRPETSARVGYRHPAWAKRLSGFPSSFELPEVRFEPGVEHERLGSLDARLRPRGLTLALGGAWQIIAWPPGPTDLDGRRAVAFLRLQHALSALRSLEDAAVAVARWHVEEAERLAPADPMVAEVRALTDKRLDAARAR